jgi:hypothetical protein
MKRLLMFGALCKLSVRTALSPGVFMQSARPHTMFGVCEP